MADTHPRVCIVVLGMHRSGTSALTRTLELLGADLPAHVIGPGPGNAAGHWEPERLVEIHERMLGEAGSRWDDWRAFDPAVLGTDRQQAYRDEITACLLEEYGGSALFVLKDPRVARFVPFYADILASMNVEARYVLCIRNPLAVIESLVARNGSARASGALMWLRHVVDSEIATRSAIRSVVAYEDLMHDWRSIATAVAESLRLSWRRSYDEVGSEVDAFLRPDLQHHRPSPVVVEQAAETSGWVQTVYQAATSLIRDADGDAFTAIDQVHDEFDRASAVFGAATFPELAARDREIAELDSERTRQQQRAEVAERRAGDAEAALDIVLNSRSWRITRPLRAASQRVARVRAKP